MLKKNPSKASKASTARRWSCYSPAYETRNGGGRGNETDVEIRCDYSAPRLPGFGSGNEGDVEIYRSVDAHAGPVLPDAGSSADLPA